jgi:hypothetical protein
MTAASELVYENAMLKTTCIVRRIQGVIDYFQQLIKC